MSRVFVIAEAACTWLHGGLEAAYRSIEAAKKCGADAWKTQFTSSPSEMGKRRGVDPEKYERLNWDPAWLPKLQAMCGEYGLEFMCTVFLPKDVARIAPYVERFKVSAFEQPHLREFQSAVRGCEGELNDWVVSVNPGRPIDPYCDRVTNLHCVSQYPTPLSQAIISAVRTLDGLSDHTTSLLTGAVAVGAGARILEKHVRMVDTPETDPDFGHSLLMEMRDCEFSRYVEYVREAERML